MSEDFNSAKFLNKQLKARGLQKLRFYCQVCNKQCRDQNGFKSHVKSPSHLKNISTVTQDDILEFTKLFEENFLNTLKTNHGEKKIAVNKLYNEIIKDRDHIHMNATSFKSLTGFIKYLSKEGKIKVYDDNIGDMPEDQVDLTQLNISFIDNLRRKEKLQEIEAEELTESKLEEYLRTKRQLREQEEEESDVQDTDLGSNTDIQRDNLTNIKIQLKKTKIKQNKVKKPLNKNKNNVFG
ncbi:Zinc-finger double-stranded RNA-binding [Nakaseomyces glabratus]